MTPTITIETPEWSYMGGKLVSMTVPDFDATSFVNSLIDGPKPEGMGWINDVWADEWANFDLIGEHEPVSVNCEGGKCVLSTYVIPTFGNDDDMDHTQVPSELSMDDLLGVGSSFRKVMDMMDINRSN